MHHKYSIHCLKEAAFLCPVPPSHSTVGGRGAASSFPALVIWTTITTLCHCLSPEQGVACYRQSAVWPWDCSIHLKGHCSMTLLWQRCSPLAFLCHTSCEHATNDKGKHLLFLILSLFCWEPGDGLLASQCCKGASWNYWETLHLSLHRVNSFMTPQPSSWVGQDESCGHCPHLVVHPHQDVSWERAERSLHSSRSSEPPGWEWLSQ